MNRAANGREWLNDHEAARSFVTQLGATCGVFPVDLHAYCLLPGHYHVLVRAEFPLLHHALTRLELASGFPSASGPRAVPVAFGRHLMSVSRYIHLNPVDAGIVWCPENWPYSSLRAYLGERDAPRWIVTEALLGRFGSIGARHRYRAYVYAGLDPGTRDADGRPRWASLFVPGGLIEDSAWRVDPGLVLRARSPALARPGTSLPQLARAVASAFDVPAAALRSVRVGGPDAARARGALVYAARAVGDHRLRDVAAWMGYGSPASAAAAAERFDRAARIDPQWIARVKAAVAPAALRP